MKRLGDNDLFFIFILLHFDKSFNLLGHLDIGPKSFNLLGHLDIGPKSFNILSHFGLLDLSPFKLGQVMGRIKPLTDPFD